MKQNIYTLLLLLLCFGVTGQTVITDSDLGSDTYNWTADTEYLLDGYVFLEAGGVLNIEAGTIIKAKGTPTGGDNASALIIAKGAQIFAEGTADKPIIFTGELDDFESLTAENKGLWGGLVILGDAVVGVNGGVQNIEGIPSTEGRAEYGGSNNEDNSGVLRYVSIRHGGSKLEANNEINGLTLGGVGSGTEIDYVEVFANLDDGIEWFGGTVSVKHAVVSFCGDDSYDYDQSWDGLGQFWFSLQDNLSNRAGEWDGSESADLQPKVSPMISNVTFIGAGSASENEDGNNAMQIRDDGAVQLYNSVITGFADGAIQLDNDADGTTLVSDSYDRYLAGELTFNNLVFFDFGDGSNLESIVSTDGGDDAGLAAYLAANGSEYVDPMLGGISRMGDGGLDPRLNAGSPALTGASLLDNDYFDPVIYKGAFGNGDNWADGWTALSEKGYFGDLVTPLPMTNIVITDSDINAGETINLTANNTYFLDGYVFVEDGATINIEAGTVIKGLGSPSGGDKSSALIISQGGMINAVGTEDAPIIMTAEFDDVNVSDDLTKDNKGLWGGLVVLGKATVGVNGGTQNIEGIPSTEGRATYGGTDDEDNSGVIKYVSIRHGGDKLEANNEINGLTLGGVGSGTEIDYVEVFANLDDGIEWFGGTVSVKHAVVSFCGDDSYDYDQSWDGKGQFWFSLQDNLSNRAGEWDGSESADLQPKVSPTISNVTFIGAGAESENEDGNNAMQIRDDGAVQLYNSVITGFADGAIQLDNDADGTSLVSDSYDRYLAGELTFDNLVFFDFGDGADLTSIVSTDGGDDAAFATYLGENGSVYADPILGGISRMGDGGLDPRLSEGSPALSGAVLLEDSYFDPVFYKGAFDNRNNWAEGWTALSDNGYFGDLVIPVSSNDIVIKDEDINAGETLDLTANNTYFLDGYVFVEDGATINIEAGTVIKGLGSPSGGDKSSALIISQGGTINALGTAEAPIIFTAELDDISDPNDLTSANKGLWGGLVVLGKATVGVNGGTQNIEGIPSTEGRATYGGTEDDDDSGIIRYVSIRHGGDKLEANNEINGLTLGGVGSGTEIDYIEVFANLDDGIEWFGGTVSVKHAVVSFCGDDSYDYDQSWDGKGQFWLSLQDNLSNRAGEWDGSESADLQPKVSPTISNVTFIGAGAESVNEDGNNALQIRDDGAVQLYNSVITGFADGAIQLDNDADGTSLVSDSYDRYLAGELTFDNLVFFDFGDGADLTSIVSTDGGDDAAFATYLGENGSVYADPILGGISRTNDGGLDPRLSEGSPALSGAELLEDSYFDPVFYKGAFDNRNNWADGWTALSDNGYFGDLVVPVSANDIVIRDEDINAGETLDLTANNTYTLDGYVFVEDGATINIEAGTVIKAAGSPSGGDKSTALIISQGGTINALGTAEAPIIFTAELDDISDPNDLTNANKGLWGGLIILGKATVGVNGGTQNIEGIPSTEGRATYGGTEDDDDSGIIRYVSIRHGGDKLEANNEINGLTLGGVGSGTEISYVEVYANLDDGIEWFGGTVSVDHAVVSFCGDDSYDYDQSWDGKGQFWFSLQDELSNRAGEWDGSESADLMPKVSPVISNVTFIGAGSGSVNEDGNNAVQIRDDGSVQLYNSVITEFADGAIQLDNDADGTSLVSDSYDRYLAGDLTFNSLVFFGFGDGETLEAIVSTDGGDDAEFATYLGTNSSVYADPGVAAISRTNDGGLDPRINGDGAAFSGAVEIADDYFTPTSYRGAFDSQNNWADGWTALSDNGYFGDFVSSVNDTEGFAEGKTLKLYPNPSNGGILNIELDLEESKNISLNITDMNGRYVKTISSAQNYISGRYRLAVDINDLPRGYYTVNIITDKGIFSNKLIVSK